MNESVGGASAPLAGPRPALGIFDVVKNVSRPELGPGIIEVVIESGPFPAYMVRHEDDSLVRAVATSLILEWTARGQNPKQRHAHWMKMQRDIKRATIAESAVTIAEDEMTRQHRDRWVAAHGSLD